MYTKYTGIILKKHPLGEADELLTIYTKEAGKLRVRAVASRKIRSRLAGNLQSLNEIDFEVAGNRSRRAGSGHIPVLISARARTLNNYVREDLKKFAYALLGAETLYRLTPDRQENIGAYEAVADFLHLLGESREEKTMARALQMNLLRLFGFTMPLSACANCLRPFSPAEKSVYFVSDKGGMFCEGCQGQGQSQVRADGDVLQELRLLNDGGRPQTLHWAAEQVIDGFLHYVLEREIKSRNFLHTLTGDDSDE